MRIALRWVAVYDDVSDAWYPELYMGDERVGGLDGLGFKDERRCALFVFDKLHPIAINTQRLERRA